MVKNIRNQGLPHSGDAGGSAEIGSDRSKCKVD